MEQAQPSLDPVQQSLSDQELYLSGNCRGALVFLCAHVGERGQNPCAHICAPWDELNAQTPSRETPWLGSTGA